MGEENTLEQGLTSHRVSHRRHQPAFWSNNPFTPSISQNIQNLRTTSGAKNLDDVDLPARPNHFHQFHSRNPLTPATFPLQHSVPITSAGNYVPPHRYPTYPAVPHVAPQFVTPSAFAPPVPHWVTNQQPPVIIQPVAHSRGRSRSPSARRAPMERARRNGGYMDFPQAPEHSSFSPRSSTPSPHRRDDSSPRHRSPSRHRHTLRTPVGWAMNAYDRNSSTPSEDSVASVIDQRGSLPPSPDFNGKLRRPSTASLLEGHLSSPNSPRLSNQASAQESEGHQGPPIRTPSIASGESALTVSSISGCIPPIESDHDVHSATNIPLPFPYTVEHQSSSDGKVHSPEVPLTPLSGDNNTWTPPLPQIPPLATGVHQPDLKEVLDTPTDYRPFRRTSTPQGSHSVTNGHAKLQDYILVFITDTIPRQIYLHLLLRMPYLYFSRVNRIFKEAELTLGEIKEMALQATAEDNKTFQDNMLNMGYYYHAELTNLSPAYQRLKSEWERFIDNLMREWKTLNIISVLLLSAIMTMFQIQGAAEDPVTRYIAFWSLICALMSVLYGCLFIIRFGTMRKVSKAAEWALEAQKSQTILWNVWVMLAMPVVWLAWSIITFIACVMSFLWRAQANLPPDYVFPAAPLTETGFRIFICTVLGIGMVYGVLITNTFRCYGAQMDEAWRRRVEEFIGSPQSIPPPPHYYFPSTPPEDFTARPTVVHVSRPNSPGTPESNGSQVPYFAAAFGPRTPGEYNDTFHVAEPKDKSMHLTRSRSSSPANNIPQSHFLASYSPNLSHTPPSPPHGRRCLTCGKTSRSMSQTPRRISPIPRTPPSRRVPSIDRSSTPIHVRKREEGRRHSYSNRRYNGQIPSLDGGGHLPKLKIPGGPLPGAPPFQDEPKELSPEAGRLLAPVLAITGSGGSKHKPGFSDVSTNGGVLMGQLVHSTS